MNTPGRVADEPVKMAITPVAAHRMNTRAKPPAVPPSTASTTFESLFIEVPPKAEPVNAGGRNAKRVHPFGRTLSCTWLRGQDLNL